MTSIVNGNFSTPYNIVKRVFTTTFTGTSPSPVEAGAKVFQSTRGNFTVQVTDVGAPADSFSIDISGGFAYIEGYTDINFYLKNLSNVGCTVTNPSVNTLVVTTNSSSKIYNIIFSPYPSLQPTIQKTGGPALTGNLIVQVLSWVPA